MYGNKPRELHTPAAESATMNTRDNKHLIHTHNALTHRARQRTSVGRHAWLEMSVEMTKRLAEAPFATTATVGVLRMESLDNSKVSRSIGT
jgi:hypothetical protein